MKEIRFWEIEPTKTDDWSSWNSLLQFTQGRIVFDDNNQKRSSWSWLGQSCSRCLIVFLSQLFPFFWYSLVAFGDLFFQKIATNQLFGWNFCVVRLGTFHPRQDYEQLDSYQKSGPYVIAGSVRDKKVIYFSQLVQNGKISTKLWQFFFLVNTRNQFILLCKRKLKNLSSKMLSQATIRGAC